MFRKIVIAYSESPESHRAFASAVQLAKSLDTDLHAVTVMDDLPAYTAYASTVDPAITLALKEDRQRFYEQLEQKARAHAEKEGVYLVTHVTEGRHVEAIISYLREVKADLLVVGLHQRELHISRLWSTVYELAQDAPCSVLGVH